MKCPRCGHENPEGNLFCEECDWRVDVPYIPEKTRNPVHFAAATIVLGIIGAVCAFVEGAGAVALVAGAVALVLGGYSMGVARIVKTDRSAMCLTVSGIGMILGVLGFLIGFASIVGAARWPSTAGSTSWRGWAGSARPWSTTWTWRTTSACHTRAGSPARCAGGAATSPT